MIARGGANGAATRSGVPGMWVGISDDVLAPEVLLPGQFQDVWHHSGAVAPERMLAMAVLSEALHDLTRYRFAKRRRMQRLYWEAYEWVTAADRNWPFSFVNLCDSLGLTVEAVRAQVLATPPAVPGEFDAVPEALLEKAA